MAKEGFVLFGNLYPRTRDAIEGARDTFETLRQDWPIMALGLVMRANGLVGEEHPEIAAYRDRESKRLRKEYLRRRWRGSRENAVRWYERELARLLDDIHRRNAEIYREELQQTLARYGKDGIQIVVDDDPRDHGG